jgi:hypothetical protein
MLRGRAGMAQFNHPEFAGSGQWMPGGMLMIGDMFNHSLKGRVDGLCQAIAGILASQPGLFPTGSFQMQNQSGGGQQQHVGTAVGQQMQFTGGGQQQGVAPAGSASGTGGTASSPLFVADPRDTWWPAELGTPNATGAQNNVRYAFFGNSGRLAVEVNGKVKVYEKGGEQSGGVAQQQSGSGAVLFTTPTGMVSLASLASVSGGFDQAHSSCGSGQQQSSSGGGLQQQSSGGGGMQPMSFGGMTPMTPMAPMSFAPMRQDIWWPPELGSPNATGSQNDLRYAYFADTGRLVVEANGSLSVHDARNHPITGVAQQDRDTEPVFTTPSGVVKLSDLPPIPPVGAAETAVPPAPVPTEANDVLASLERLGELKAKGILTEAEFSAKKAELLSRL